MRRFESGLSSVLFHAATHQIVTPANDRLCFQQVHPDRQSARISSPNSIACCHAAIGTLSLSTEIEK